jgi:flotillin
MGNIIVATPNEAVVVSGFKGSRILVGECAFVWMCCETYGRLSLEVMTLELHSVEAETVKGVPVSVKGIAQVKVMANKYMTVSQAKKKGLAYNVKSKGGAGVNIDNPLSMEQDGGSSNQDEDVVETANIDIGKIKIAAQHFLGRKQDSIREALRLTMEGHQRQILGTLTVEDLFRDRAAFSNRVREHVTEDLNSMGFCLVSYTVTKIEDGQGYMKALGATQTAIVRREAEEGQARNESEARKKVALYKSDADIASAKAEKDSHVSKNEQAQAKAESDKELNMKKADFDRVTNKANEEANAMSRITKAEQDKIVIREVTMQREEEARVLIQVAEAEMTKVKTEAEGRSMAELLRQQNEAKGVEVEANAQASRIRNLGLAEAEAIQKKGEAEAEVMRQKAEAFKQYGEAAVVQSIVDRLPEIVESIAKPLSKTDKMVFISQDGSSGSQLTRDITNIVASVPETVEGLTGVNLRTAMSKLSQ